jgi:hypothetical protein
MGVFSLMKGIGKGITGVVTEPIKGGKEKGGKGVLTGMLKGIGGLVTKPVAGALDVASKTAEGIKNTPSRFIKNKDAKRKRDIRALYGPNQVIKTYDYNDT